MGTNNKLLLVGCESGLVVCAHVARRQELYKKQLDSACNACIVLDQNLIVGCHNGKVNRTVKRKIIGFDFSFALSISLANKAKPLNDVLLYLSVVCSLVIHRFE